MKKSQIECAPGARLPQHLAALVFLCLPLAAQTGGPGGQAAASLKLKAEARLVLVDAVVADKKDEPIHGLAAKDFHVFEDGKEQTVTVFQTHTGPAAPGVSQQQHFVLFFDGHSTDDQKWIEQAAAKFVADNAGPNRLMSVVAYRSGCLTIAEQFTADVGRLQKALGMWPNLGRCPPVPDPYGDVRADNYTLLAKDLAHVPGHKVVALFVAHAPPAVNAANRRPTPPPRITSQKNQRPSARSTALERNAGTLSDPKGMQLEFRKADVSVYPVEGQSGARTPAWALSLADATGGHEISRGNDVLAVFDLLAREQDESYTLGYVPADSPEGSCHTIKVTVDHSGAKVRGRNLYCNIPETTLAAASPLENELENLADAAPHSGSIAASASVPYFYEASGVARVDLALEIPSPVLEPTEVYGKLHASMDVLGLAYNLGGEVAARFSDTVRYYFDNRQQFDDFLRRPLRYEHQFEIAPGNYRFKLVFRSAKDRIGVVETPLAVDPYHAGQLGLSAIALSRDVQPMPQDAAQLAAEEGKKPLIFRGNRINVSGSDLLLRTGTAEAYFEIYEPQASGAEPVQLTMHLRLLDAQSNEPKWDSGDVDLSALAKSGNRVIPVALKLPVAALPPATYHAELTVKDSAGGETRRSTQFRLE